MKISIAGIAIAFVFAQSAFAEISPIPELAGSYAGCGKTRDGEVRPIAFNIVEMPYSAEGETVNYTASLVWDVGGTGNIHFPEIRFSSDQTRFVMTTNIVPRTEYGTIVVSVLVHRRADGSLAGEMRSNSTNPLTRNLHGGTWTAKKIEDGQAERALSALRATCR